MISRKIYAMPMKIVKREVIHNRDYSPRLSLYRENFQSYLMRKDIERKDSNLSSFGVFFINLFNLNSRLEKE